MGKKSGILVEFSELSLHFEMRKDPSEADLEEIQNYLYKRSVAREIAELENLKGLFNAFRKVSFLAGNMPSEKEDTENFEEQPETKVEVRVNELTSKSDKLKIFLKEYFDNTTSAVESALSNLENKDNGSLSPNFPAKQWGRVRRYWRAHLDIDFPVICKIATQEVVRLRCGRK